MKQMLYSFLWAFFFLLFTPFCRCVDEDTAGGMNRGDPFIQGTLKLNGKTYRAICNCNQGKKKTVRK